MFFIVIKLNSYFSSLGLSVSVKLFIFSLFVQLEDCIGSAVDAMGPEILLSLIPISINKKDFSCSNIWLIPILKKNIVGSSLQFFIEHIIPLAKSFEKGSHKGIYFKENLNLYFSSLKVV